MSNARAQLFAELYADRMLAHQYLFAHRHKDATPAYHAELIADFHSTEKELLDMVFRGGAKSTIAEEAIVIRAGFREFRYALVVGDTIDRACQRLHAIRFEIETNEKVRLLFGDLMGPVWSADQLMLSTGVMIQALGKGQSLRGVKHLDQRPDFLFGDDLENDDDVRDERTRDRTWRWFTGSLMRALDPSYRARIAATPLDPDALPMRLEKIGWKTHRIPVYYVGEDGGRVSAWPERFPLTREEALRMGARASEDDPTRPRIKSVEELEAEAQRFGTMKTFKAEMLCEAETPESKPFRKEMFRLNARDHRWEPVFCMFDPNRTVGRNSAFCGFAAWSWVGAKLIVWDAWQKPLMPAEIVDAMFQLVGAGPGKDVGRLCEALFPVMVGVEEDGLNEWLLQPIRAEMARRNISLPLQPVRAPKGKLDFIRALQVFFFAREVEFARELPELEQALLAFPSGRIDAPNALAYALPMRGGAPIYGDFADRHVAADIEPAPQKKAHLALNATGSMTTAVLVQFIEGAVRIFADWISEGEPGAALEGILGEARLAAGRQSLGLVAPPQHFERWSSVGLTQAASGQMQEVTRGTEPLKGRPVIRQALQREIRGMPALVVSEEARWTLNALAGGYRHLVTKQGLVADTAEEGRYRLLMEGLESFAGLTETPAQGRDEREANYAFTPGGQRYESALPMRAGAR